jgi:hypothetical protein
VARIRLGQLRDIALDGSDDGRAERANFRINP